MQWEVIVSNLTFLFASERPARRFFLAMLATDANPVRIYRAGVAS